MYIRLPVSRVKSCIRPVAAASFSGLFRASFFGLALSCCCLEYASVSLSPPPPPLSPPAPLSKPTPLSQPQRSAAASAHRAPASSSTADLGAEPPRSAAVAACVALVFNAAADLGADPLRAAATAARIAPASSTAPDEDAPPLRTAATADRSASSSSMAGAGGAARPAEPAARRASPSSGNADVDAQAPAARAPSNPIASMTALRSSPSASIDAACAIAAALGGASAATVAAPSPMDDAVGRSSPPPLLIVSERWSASGLSQSCASSRRPRTASTSIGGRIGVGTGAEPELTSLASDGGTGATRLLEDVEMSWGRLAPIGLDLGSSAQGNKHLGSKLSSVKIPLWAATRQGKPP
eukprot:364222-Chlamydomonas_euryale.AAC.3